MHIPKIMVMGVGNLLLTDEGLGIHFLKELEQVALPNNVELLEGGTAGLELVHLIQEVDYLIIIDALNANAEPGALFRFRPDDLKVFPDKFEVSFHQVGILEVLAMANILGKAPETLVYGIQPKSLEWGLEVSREIADIFPRLKELVLSEINSIIQTGNFRILPSSGTNL
ncbi:MAG: HyaD/HybD family hydrogenase maturation endopeptidase [Desulfitobacterium hafniense]|nr:HyaD/HybD family hydrogenase maturation endopeptidase [Desulfitobacterium hafniense]